MIVGEPKDVEAILGIDVPTSELESSVRKHVGQSIEIVELKVADVMAAQLSGHAFDIDPQGRIEQPISRKEPKRWTWTVTPRSVGPKELSLTFYAHVVINCKERPRRLEPVLKKPIQVNVTWPQWTSANLQYIGNLSALKEFWMMLVGAVSSIWGGLILIREKIRVSRGHGETAN